MKRGLVERTVNDNPDLPYYDLRLVRNREKTDDVVQAFEKYRQVTGKSDAAIASTKDSLVSGEEFLRQRVPSLKVEYNDDLQVPEVIGTDVLTRDALAATGIPANRRHADAVRNFLKENNNLIGLGDDQITNLKTIADYTNPDGNVSYVDLGQEINGVPVFRGEIRAGITKDGRIFRTINNLAPGLDYETLSKDFGRPEDAVFAAARHINREATDADVKWVGTKSNGNMIEFERGQFGDRTTAERMYFPLEPGVAVPAWRVLLHENVAAYYVVVDTQGRMLWRKNIVNDQTQAATYNVYDSDSPAPSSPTTALPGANFQAPVVPRVNFTLIGNEAPNPGMNNLGWMTDGTNGVNGHTDGNNAEAGLDIVAPDGVDAPVPGVNRVFNFAYNPAPGNPAPGDDPTTPNFRNGMVTNMFYWANVYHDRLYQVGFNEAARNFQNDNFGRGGLAADRLRVEGQDSSGTNNANMLTPADGGRGRSQMYRFTTSPADVDRDSGLDQEILIHELTHGTSNRLIGNATGLGNNRGGSMGEGWGDFYGRVLTSTGSEDVTGVYSTGGWATFNFANVAFTNNYYYGIRRFPYALKTTVGGPLMRPHNPLTFADIDPAQLNVTDGAFPVTTLPISTSATEVHNAGEVWCMALLEVRARIITRLGFAAGNQRMLQLTTDGMKLTPVSPTFTQARDAILSASQALGGTDTADIWAGFATRGQGFGSSDSNANSAVVQSFALPDVAANAATVTSGNNLLEPNECNTLNIPISNNSANSATGITAVLSSTTPGITVSQPNSAYPDMPSGSGPVNNTTPFQVSTSNSIACFTQANFTLTLTFTGGGGGSPVVTNFSLPVGNPGTNYASTTQTGQTIPAGGVGPIAGSQADDAAVTVPLPAGWNSTVYGTAVTSLSASTNGALTINGATSTAFDNTALPGAAFGIGLFPYWDDLIMTTASVTGGGIFTNTIGSAPNRQFYIEWRAQHFDETTNGPITTNFAILLTEGSDVVRFVYASTGIGAQLNGASATVGIQAAATGTQFTQFSFNGASLSVGLQITYTRPPGQCTPGSGTCASSIRSRADFDGDGRTDLSVFRPSEGNWYLQRSTAGFGVLNWGISSDVLAPGDFDGDGKADTTVFRANADSSQPDFYILNSNGFTVSGVSWGIAGDIPISGDYDGDGKTDVGVFRPSNSTWFILKSGGGTTVMPYGVAGDVPVAGDFVGDSKADIAIFRPSTNQWWVFNGVGDTVTVFGSAGDILVPADYDGDNKDDIAVFRPSTGQWIIRRSSDGGTTFATFGASGDVPVPGDYDGDGKDDFAIYRNGTWWMFRSTAGISVANFGLATDKAIPRAYVP